MEIGYRVVARMKVSARTLLLTPAGKIDRRAVALEAHRQLEQSKRLGLGWTLGRCFSYSWNKARGQQDLSLFNQVERAAKELIND